MNTPGRPEPVRRRKLPRGVKRCPWTGKYVAHIVVDGARQSLGSFDSPEDASRMYAVALERRKSLKLERKSTQVPLRIV